MGNTILRRIAAGIIVSTTFYAGLYAQQSNSFSINLGNDTLICPGDALYLDAGDYFKVLWNNGSKKKFLLVTEPGTYSVQVTNKQGEIAVDTINIGFAVVPVVILKIPAEEYFCKGEKVKIETEVSNGNGSEYYKWENKNHNQKDLEVDTTGNYQVTVTNEYGCEATEEVYLEFQYPYEEEKILLASYDPVNQKNMIIWSKTTDKRTQKYAVYSGSTESDFLSYSDYSEKNICLDINSTPSKKEHSYNLRVLDSCNNLSSLKSEKAHKTMCLKVTAQNKGAMLMWNAYEGFEYEKFYIYRGRSINDMHIIDSVERKSNSGKLKYIDESIEKGVLYQYMIKVKCNDTIYIDNPGDKKAGNGPFVHSLSNLDDVLLLQTGFTDLEYTNQYLKIYPNPSKETTTIYYKLNNAAEVEITVYNLTGNKVACIKKEYQLAGEHSLMLSPNAINLTKGIYFIKLCMNNSGSATRRVIVQ